MDEEQNIQELKDDIQEFCEARNWDEYHNPKDLSIGIITEASELLEHFRFKNKEEMVEYIENQESKNEIKEELADIMHFLIRFAQMYDIDITKSIKEKLEKNKERFPAETEE